LSKWHPQANDWKPDPRADPKSEKSQQDSAAGGVLFVRSLNMKQNMKPETKILSATILLAGTICGFGQPALTSIANASSSRRAEAASSDTQPGRQASDLKAISLQARQGDAHSQYLLGRIYEAGNGARENAARAAEWYRKAADQNLAPAQYSLGRLYAAGTGVAQDYSQAMQWFRRAAAKDYALAKNRLGMMYEKGQGVGQDYVEAYKWYALAAAGNQNVFGVANRDALARRMTPDQLVEAQCVVDLVALNSAF
jgi:TPR repeat protein